MVKDKTFVMEETVLVLDFRWGEEKWILGLVASQEGSVSYTVYTGLGAQWRRHTDQL